MSNPTNMKELCAYAKQQQQKRGREHRRAHSHEKCSGLTDIEYNAVVTRQKSTFAKGKSYAYTARWRAFTETL
jgi:hypothetical protein